MTSAVKWFLACMVSLGISASACVVALVVSLNVVGNNRRLMEENATLAAENSFLRESLAEQDGDSQKTVVVTVAGPSELATPRTLSAKARNWLNIKSGRTQWVGQIGTDAHGHAIFEHPAYSLRAGAIVLRTYEEKHGIDTVKDLVERFAEGNQGAYIRFLCDALGVKPTTKISLTGRMAELLPAMVRFETGRSLDPAYVALVAALR